MLKMLAIVALAVVAGQAMSKAEQSIIKTKKKIIDCQDLEKKLCQKTKEEPCQNVNLKLVTHGFGSSNKSVEGVKDAWLAGRKGTKPTRVIILDWKESADGTRHSVWVNINWYRSAAKNALGVGTSLGECLAKLVGKGLDPNKIHLVGHSLGAHLVGKAGREFTKKTRGQKVGRVTGLDPAGPGWVGNSPFTEVINEKLSKDSAKFVDVIHTNGDTSGNQIWQSNYAIKFGALQPLGHIDFYPDGGRNQNICKITEVGCSHSQAIEWFRQSINDQKKFKGKKCSDYEKCTSGTRRTTEDMGEGVSKSGSGWFFVKMPTTDAPEDVPFNFGSVSVGSALSFGG